MDNKKIIGIVGHSKGDSSFGIGKAYISYIRQFGNVVVLPQYISKEFILGTLNAIVFPGGLDINPLQYGSIPSFDTSNSDPILEYWDKQIPAFLGKIPIIGICRGLQAINVALGGSLSQNVFHPFSENGRWDLVHEVIILDGKEKGKKLKVNSLHHQGFYDYQQSKQLTTLAHHVDGIVEAAWNPDLKVVGFQWHPEEIFDRVSKEFINEILL